MSKPRASKPLLTAVTVAAIGLAFWAGSSWEARAQPNAKTISYSRVVNLDHVIDTNIPLWPGDPAVKFKTVATLKKDGYYLRQFSMGEHSATHMNAPNSFHEGASSIASYAAESLVAPVVVIDARAECAKNADYALSKAKILEWEGAHGQIPAGSLVVMFTGWEAKWQNSKAFFDQDAKGNLHFPGFSGAAAKFLLEERHIRGVGIDTHGADPGLDTSYATNAQVTAVQGIVLENLTNLAALPTTGATVVIGVPRLANGSGAPVAVTAFIP